MEKQKFYNLEELNKFIDGQCSDCNKRGRCVHYGHLVTSRDTQGVVRHWSGDVFARSEDGLAYCRIKFSN